MVEQIDKLSAAQRQLDTAIRLVLDDGDKLAIQTLSWAAFNVLVSYDKATNSGTVWGDLLRRGPLFGAREIGNFLKHADRDPAALLQDFPIGIPELIIRFSARLYHELTGTWTDEMRAFEIMMQVQDRFYREDEQKREQGLYYADGETEQDASMRRRALLKVTLDDLRNGKKS